MTFIRRPHAALAFIGLVTLYRVIMLAFDHTDLYVDEAQYWLWAQNLDWGYYSKPPMIAWVINATTALGTSDSTFWVRIGSPLFHMATAFTLMAAARRLAKSDLVAAWVGVTYITIPGVTLSAIFLSTDTFLLFFYALALFAYSRLIEKRSVKHALLLGLAVGLGVLSKYAMLYFAGTALIAALALPQARIAIRDTAIAAFVAIVVVSPNLWWNHTHGDVTFRHTSQNADWNGLHFKFGTAAEFLGSQFGVVGPVIFAALLWALYRRIRRQDSRLGTHLFILSWPIIGVIIFQALMSDANANWAATAYIAGIVLAVVLLLEKSEKALEVSLWINTAAAILLPIAAVFVVQIVDLSHSRLMQRYVGRDEVSREIARVADREQVTAIVGEDRNIMADLFYTLRDSSMPIKARPTGRFPDNYYQQEFTLDPTRDPGPVLLVTRNKQSCAADEPKLVETLTPMEGFMAGRSLYLYRIEGSCLAAKP
jgi:lipid A galacturonosyltransferase RgtD